MLITNPLTHPSAHSTPGAGFCHMLVCVDRSEAAEAVLPLATHLAQQDGASMTLLHVLETPADRADSRSIDPLEWEVVRQEARAYLDGLAERIADVGIAAETHVAEGAVGHAVSALTARLQTDLLVLSSAGGGALDASTIGGTARKILARARGPVLIVPAGTREPASHVPLRRVLVPLDGSVRGECALPTALRLARADDAEIVVGHVVVDPVHTELLSTPEDLALVQHVADRLALRAGEYLERIQSQLSMGGVRASVATRRATDHRHGLVALAAGEQVDLIVLSAHGSVCNPRRRFGSVTSYLIAHSAVPVLMIQDLRDPTDATQTTQPPLLPPRAVDADSVGT